MGFPRLSDDTAKIRLKIGQLEVEYEGRASFLQDGLFNLMEKMVGFYAEHKASILAAPLPAQTNGAGPTGSLGELGHSTNTIAGHLDVKTGPGLVIAAAAHLGLVEKKNTFTRQEINDEMKSATTYYKESMSGNLSKSLDTLVRDKRLNQTAKGVYALSATEKKALGTKLAQ